MVSLDTVQASNAAIATTLPAGLVGVFAGATSGIGEAALKEFARRTIRPRLYFVGRSREAGERITAELVALNPDGQYHFLAADTSLLRNVDAVCAEIRAREPAINVLLLSQGSIKTGIDTAEGLNYMMALSYYARVRFAANLLPQLRRAAASQGLARVVTVLAGAKEGRLYPADFQARSGGPVPLTGFRGHVCSMTTLSLEALAARAPGVSFIHDYPGAVATNLMQSHDSLAIRLAGSFLFSLAMRLRLLPAVALPECGKRHVFLFTSARYPAAPTSPAGVVPHGAGIARGCDGTAGSGVYSVDWDDESAPPKVEDLLANYRRDGMVERLWKHTEDEFVRITGTTALPE